MARNMESFCLAWAPSQFVFKAEFGSTVDVRRKCSMRCNTAAGNGNLPGKNSETGVEKARIHLETLFHHSEEINAVATCSCPRCGAAGDVQCATCTGSGLYVDSILESQGIIKRVQCLGCGGSGDILCPRCGGRGQVEAI